MGKSPANREQIEEVAIMLARFNLARDKDALPVQAFSFIKMLPINECIYFMPVQLIEIDNLAYRIVKHFK